MALPSLVGERKLSCFSAVDPVIGWKMCVKCVAPRSIAQSRTHAGGTPDSLAELKERFNVSAQRGERTHLREETRLALEFPQGGTESRHAALVLARDNFSVQRETEDIRLFARAAVDARDPDALATLKEWLRHSHYEDIVVDQLLRSGQSS